MSFVTAVMTETSHELVAIPMPTIMYGAISIIIFAALGFVLWSYRDVAHRHALVRDAHAPHPGHDVATTKSEH